MGQVNWTRGSGGVAIPAGVVDGGGGSGRRDVLLAIVDVPFEANIDAIRAHLLEAVNPAAQPTHVSVWIKR